MVKIIIKFITIKSIDKLYRYGVRGAALNLIKSFFGNRWQYVSFGSVDSKFLGYSGE